MRIGKQRIGLIFSLVGPWDREMHRCLMGSSFQLIFLILAPPVNTGSKWNIKFLSYLRSSRSLHISLSSSILARHSFLDFLDSSSIVILLILESHWQINWLYRVDPSLEQDCCHLHNSPIIITLLQGKDTSMQVHCWSQNKKSCGQWRLGIIEMSIR